jgi:ABC-type polysaccharide/polyol phosphate export permease
LQTQRIFLLLHTKDLVRLRFRGACLGLAWNILQPALYLMLLGFVFAVVNQSNYADFVVYLFAGLVPWRFFDQACSAMIDSIASSAVFTRGFRVPYFYFPASELGAQLIDFLASFLTLLALLLLFKTPWHLQMLILPLSVLVWLLLTAGAGLCLSVIFVFFRDIRPIVQMGLMLALFSSTVFFKPATLSGRAGQIWLTINPVCYWAALFQKPIYYGVWPLALDWTVSLASAAVLILLGTALYRSLRHKFYFYF